jgi:beta-galactosidase
MAHKAALSTEAYHYWRRRHSKEESTPKPGHRDYTREQAWFLTEGRPYMAGIFLWTGMEYLGEVRDPYPYHGRTNAPVRITGFLKPQAHFQHALWGPNPNVAIGILDEEADIPRGKIHFDFPKIVQHWDFAGRSPQMRQVYTYTNCESVELWLNGRRLGQKHRRDFQNNEVLWEVPYEPGDLWAVGLTGGNPCCEAHLTTAGPPARVVLTTDASSLHGDGKAVANVEVEIHNEHGVISQLTPIHLTCTVTGPGRIIGVDGGDLASHAPYQGSALTTYWGQGLVLVQSAQGTGVITLTVHSDALGDSVLEIPVTPMVQ